MSLLNNGGCEVVCGIPMDFLTSGHSPRGEAPFIPMKAAQWRMKQETLNLWVASTLCDP